MPASVLNLSGPRVSASTAVMTCERTRASSARCAAYRRLGAGRSAQSQEHAVFSRETGKISKKNSMRGKAEYPAVKPRAELS